MNHSALHHGADAVRVGIVSDTHGELDARIAATISTCHVAIHAGDIMGRHVLDQLQPHGGQVIAVRGNNDVVEKWPAREHDALLALPFEATLALPGGELVVVHGDRHGAPRSLHQRLRRTFADARAIVYGHSHHMVCDCTVKPWVVNPGAAGRTRTFGGPSCLVLEAGHGDWQVREIRYPLLPRRRALAAGA